MKSIKIHLLLWSNSIMQIMLQFCANFFPPQHLECRSHQHHYGALHPPSSHHHHHHHAPPCAFRTCSPPRKNHVHAHQGGGGISASICLKTDEPLQMITFHCQKHGHGGQRNCGGLPNHASVLTHHKNQHKNHCHVNSLESTHTHTTTLHLLHLQITATHIHTWNQTAQNCGLRDFTGQTWKHLSLHIYIYIYRTHTHTHEVLCWTSLCCWMKVVFFTFNVELRREKGQPTELQCCLWNAFWSKQPIDFNEAEV